MTGRVGEVEARYKRQFSFRGMQVEERIFKSPDSDTGKVVWCKYPFEQTRVDGQYNILIQRDFTNTWEDYNYHPIDNTMLCHAREQCMETFVHYYGMSPTKGDYLEAGAWDMSPEILELCKGTGIVCISSREGYGE